MLTLMVSIPAFIINSSTAAVACANQQPVHVLVPPVILLYEISQMAHLPAVSQGFSQIFLWISLESVRTKHIAGEMPAHYWRHWHFNT
jgi:hypothetical protein